MPTYDYECENCNATLEKEHSINDAPHKKCIVCGKDSLKRIISRSTFILKGNGWYKDGYTSSKGDV